MRKTRITAFILTLAMLIACMPATVAAEGDDDVAEVGTWQGLCRAINDTSPMGKSVVRLKGDVLYDDSSYIEVSVDRTVTIDLAGHTIDRGLSDSDAENDGFVIENNGTLTITDSAGGGKITGGNTLGDGGGIINYGTLNLEGGTICGNKARNSAGGVRNYSDAVFNMSGGEISGNEAKVYHGGGVYNGGTMNLTGGMILGNSAGDQGGGILENGDFLTVSGSPIIRGNAANQGKNVYLRSDRYINVTGKLTSNARIFVTSASGTGLVASGYGTYNDVFPSAFFAPDDPSLGVCLVGDSVEFASGYANDISYIERSWSDGKVVETPGEYNVIQRITSSMSEIAGGWYCVKENVTISNFVQITGEVHLILCDGATLTVTKGIRVESTGKLYIYGQDDDSGKLVSTGSSHEAGIRVSKKNSLLEIHGGDVTAVGKKGAAGIGADSTDGYGSISMNGTVRIFGGKVFAKGSMEGGTSWAVHGAGIGGSGEGDGGTVEIYGGDITITRIDAAGIGSGDADDDDNDEKGSGGDVKIYGGTIDIQNYEDGGQDGYRPAIGGQLCGSDGTLDLGDDMTVLYKGNPVTADKRKDTCFDDDIREVVIKVCDHPGKTYTTDEFKHTQYCDYCNLNDTFKTEDHVFDNNGCCTVCSYDSGLRTVTFDSAGGSSVPSQNVTSGNPVAKPEDPVWAGMTFRGWYAVDPDTGDVASSPYDFASPVTSSLTLTAKWTHEHDGISFEPWTSSNSLPDETGNYVLTCDVTLSDTWHLNGKNIALCLNGHKITKTSNDGSVMEINYGVLDLFDEEGGVITREHAKIIKVSSGTFNMHGGTITGGDEGVILENGSFHMSGGIITGNMTGVTHTSDSAEFCVSGNIDITENDCDDVLLDNLAVINISGPLDPSSRIGIVYLDLSEKTHIFTNGLSGNGNLNNFIKDFGNFRIALDPNGEAKMIRIAEICFEKGDDAATGWMGMDTVDWGSEYTLPACGFELEGATFKEWSISNLYGEHTVIKQPGDKVIVTENLYAKAVYKEQDPSPTSAVTPSATPKPSISPSVMPSTAPTATVTPGPSVSPSTAPSGKPTVTPTKKPSVTPAKNPTATPAGKPSVTPAKNPTATPTKKPVVTPAKNPTTTPAKKPSVKPTVKPSVKPSASPTRGPAKPTSKVTSAPTSNPASKLKLDKKTAVVTVGKTLTLKVSGATGLKWTSSASNVAAVNGKGVVTAKQAGSAVITVTSSDGGRAECVVQVLYKDVTSTADFWYAPTNYLTNLGVVKGYDKQTLFKPANDCTRAQMLTFMWRLMGEPAPKSATCKFGDVKKSDYFYKPVIWAVEKGITTGYKDGTFKPKNVCTRAQTVTFLWRMAGKPNPGWFAANPFKDVKTKDYFYKPVLWASAKKIVAGYTDGTFRPQGKCLRRQMVTFLYKYDRFVNGKK